MCVWKHHAQRELATATVVSKWDKFVSENMKIAQRTNIRINKYEIR